MCHNLLIMSVLVLNNILRRISPAIMNANRQKTIKWLILLVQEFITQILNKKIAIQPFSRYLFAEFLTRIQLSMYMYITP